MSPAPTVLLEVTSDSSEEYDTGDKLEHYRSIPSLRDVIVVSHRARAITVHSRGTDGTWTVESIGPGQRAALQGIPAALSVDDVYAKSSIP